MHACLCHDGIVVVWLRANTLTYPLSSVLRVSTQVLFDHNIQGHHYKTVARDNWVAREVRIKDGTSILLGTAAVVV